MTSAILTIGGSDSCGGAGIQADLQTLSALGLKGCSAITALTAQNPEHISRIEPTSLAQLEAEIRSVFDYYDVQVVKTGMLCDSQRIRLVVTLLKELHAGRPIIVDPVMISSSGRALLDDDALEILKDELIPMATLITPNIPEAESLLGTAEADSHLPARLSARFSTPILLKGGHADSMADTLVDILCIDGEESTFSHQREVWKPEIAHGTGCKLASAIAGLLAEGAQLQDAVAKAVAWLQACNSRNA